MEKDVLIVDNFSMLNLYEFPEFVNMAKRCGLKNIKEAYEWRSYTFSIGGDNTELRLKTNPEMFPDPIKRVLAFFVISLALSQYQKFRYTNGSSGFLGMNTNYITVVGIWNKTQYALEAKDFYKSALRLCAH
jgi:hypothetical protein